MARRRAAGYLRPNNKYGNIKREFDGHTFDSIKEMHRYQELKLLERAGEIIDLKLQVPFELQPAFTLNGVRYRKIEYIADFCYVNANTEEMVIEDVKSAVTRENAVYRLKKKMMAYKGYEVKEV